MRWRYAEAQATVLLNDGFAVLDRERPDVDSKLGDNFDVSGDRVGKRHALPLVARFTNDRWDNTVGVCDRLDTRLRRQRARQLHGSWRVTQFLQWAAPPPLARVTQAEWHERRLAVSTAAGSEPAIEGGSVRALFEQRLLPLASGLDAAFVALWLHTFRSFTTPRSLFDCLEKRYAELDQLCNPKLGPRCVRCCAACTKWELPAFDDARLLNLNKKRSEADVLRCVRRCQRSEYVFAPQRRDRPLPLARAQAV